MRLDWEKSQPEAQKMEAAGLGGLAAPAPEQLPECEVARNCWLFCGGWNPERWAAYESLCPVEDWGMIIELMMVIRKAM